MPTANNNRGPVLLDAKDASGRLGISPRYLADLTAKDAIPSTKIGRLRKYPVAALDAWIEAGCPTEAGAARRIAKGGRR